MSSIYKPPQGKGTLTGGTILGIAVSALLFLAIPLTQIFTEYEKPEEETQEVAWSTPPPPEPEKEEEEPPPPEEEPPPPELSETPPPLSLEQLDLALNPGTGGSLGGDFTLPTFDVNQKELGGLEIFDLGDVDSPPKPKTQIEFKKPSRAKNTKGVVRIEYIVSANGQVESITVKESPSDILSKAVVDTIKRTRFEPATKGNKPVRVRMFAAVPFK